MDVAVNKADEPKIRADAPQSGHFESILFETGRHTDKPPEPACFRDLNLDQIVRAAISPKQEYDLAPFFHEPLRDTGAISYRQDVFHDLEKPEIARLIETFADEMRRMRNNLAQAKKLYYKYQRERLFLDSGAAYSTAVRRLAEDLRGANPTSRGLRSFSAYVLDYVASSRFEAFVADTEKVGRGLADIRYSLLIRSSSIQVRNYDSEPDYSAAVAASFEKFQLGQVGEYAKNFGFSPEMNHVEAGILEYVARLHPDVFGALDAYCSTHAGFPDPVITRFDREIQFYICWLAYRAKFDGTGLAFCFPEVSNVSKELESAGGFDLALADKLIAQHAPVITNDFSLKDPERAIVVSGPNQGGKTTFARMFGQLNYLAALGCPIPGRRARTFLFDEMFTHFEREEDISTLRGKLEDDLFRIHEILGRATTRSIIIMNEIFTSTTLSDAIILGERVMQRIIDLDLLCVCVTFIDELAALGEKVVSMASTVVPDNPAQRTFKIVRKPADGKAYAVFVAERYGLTFDRIEERLKQ